MSEKNSIVIVSLDHITLRWENEDVNPKSALALGVVMNDRAERALPELSKVTSDMMNYGSGFCRVTADSVQHIPLQEVMQ